MSTYAEQQGNAPFDWNAFLAANEHTDHEWWRAEDLASQWVTCACGNQCDKIQRSNEGFTAGAPIDVELAKLGMEFYSMILHADIKNAKSILHQIEQRSAELLEEMK